MQQSKMSIPTNFQGLRVSVERGEKVGNKTNFHSSGDDNANQITSVSDIEEAGLIQVTRYNTGSIPPLVCQSESPDKIVIWGSEQQCVVPELREFEIHTFLGSQEENNEEEDDGESMRDGKDEGPMSISSSSTASSASTGVKRNEDQSREESSKRKEKRIACHSVEELDTYLSGSEEKNDTRSGRARLTGCLKESKSETNVFVSSLSTVALSGSLSSALDSSGETCLISLSSPTTNPFPNTNNPTSAQSSKREASLDTNQNSPPLHPQEYDCPQYYGQEQRQEERGHHRNGVSYEGGLGQRRRAGFEERVLPPRRQQLVRPLCQTEMIRERSLPEPKTQQTKTVLPSSIDASPESHSSRSNKKFTKSALREPSDLSHLYNLSSVSHLRQPNQAFQRETPPMEKQPTTQHLSGPSNTPIIDKKPQAQLTYRRNSSSPSKTGIESRSSTPPQSPLRTPQGSPCQQPSMYLISRNVFGASRHVPSGCNPAVPTSAQGYRNSCLRAPVKTNISTSGIPKAPLCIQQSSTNCNPKENSPSPKLKPKGVRPKIITSVRKNPQLKLQAADGPYQVSSLPSRLSTYTHSQPTVALKDPSKDPSKPETETQGARVLSASNPLYDKYRQGMQVNSFQPGMQNRSLRAPGHTNTVPPAHAHSHNISPKLSGRAENYYGTLTEGERSHSFKGISSEDAMQGRTATQTGGSGSLIRSSRGLRLGLGAVTRTTAGSIKARGPSPGQRSTPGFSQPIQTVSPAINHKNQDNTDDQVISHQAPAVPPAATTTSQPPSTASRSPLSKFSQSGLRPPGFSSNRLPAGRLAAFGFVRSSSVSSASSAHSADSAQSDPCRTAHGVNVSEELPLHRVTKSPPLIDQHRGPPCRSSSGLQPPSTPVLPRRYLPPPPKSSPGVGRKEFQRSLEVTRSLPSSPKRLAVVPPKLQSPVQPGQRPAAAVRGSTPTGSPRRVAPLKPQQESLQREKEEAQKKEQEKQADEKKKMEQREEVQRLQRHCELQERQLKALRNELSRASLGLDAFIITTQHYCLKNEAAEKGQRKLSLELQKAKEEMTFQSVRWERLQQDKTALEVAFERELQQLQVQQEAELAAVEESLRKCHAAELEHLKEEHRLEMEELTTQQQEQMEEVTVNHQAAMQELRDMHNITMATLHEEHARTMRDLRKAHEQQKLLLEEDFEKLKLSLQDQVDTLTFQNQSLKEKAKRFEEALRKSTDEQIIDALAPYQHIEKDLKSLKEVVEMKNQQIHQQERKISDLEKVQAQKNVFLEEKIQVLQQQNEDMKARIEMNVAMSRQLSEKNANLQESVEKESTEKKRLSRNNEELLWLLQTSPLMSPASSPLHRSSFSTSPVPSSPLFSSSPLAGCDSPTHCHGCPRQAQHCSPSHRSVINQNLSPGPATPTHRAAVNYNYSSGPNTPTHRALSGRCNSNTSLQN
ncbi:microtubule-associated tumor suppressor candidate 2 isoform X1 [Cyprinodon tularosa]|uniref:microtubule-associated tumor suppressor candidate 2 isoform X1 n=1 Tax=Cyprinodon tularosa TaxID=77115 RepID=UPI0018E258B2|nr:microtubule-associated tumor suppressor candidate 2 isoform X1 [Cyprinodon tularosa]